MSTNKHPEHADVAMLAEHFSHEPVTWPDEPHQLELFGQTLVHCLFCDSCLDLLQETLVACQELDLPIV